MLKRSRPQDELDRRIKAAKQNGRYMVTVFQINEQTGNVDCYRITNKFPIDAFELAVGLLDKQIEAEKNAAKLKEPKMLNVKALLPVGDIKEIPLESLPANPDAIIKMS